MCVGIRMSARLPPRRIAAKAAAKPAESATPVAIDAKHVADTAAAEKVAEKVAETTDVTTSSGGSGGSGGAADTANASTKAAKGAKAGKGKKAGKAEGAEGAEGAEATESDADDADTRTQLQKVLGFVISPARCSAHLKMDFNNADVEAEIAAATLAEKEAAEGDKASAKKALAEAHKKRIRIGQKAPIAVAATWHTVLIDIITAGMAAVKEAGHKSITVEDLHKSAGAKYSGLYKQCPTWANYSAEAEAAAEAKAKAKADAGAGAGAEAGEAGEDEGKGVVSKTTFSTYVDNAMKKVKEAEGYAKIRVMRAVREHLTALVAEGIKHMADIAQTIVKGPKGGKGAARTFTCDHVKTVNSICLVGEAGLAGELNAFIDTKIAEFEKHRAAEAAKKEEEKTPEQKAEAAAKEKAAALKKALAGAQAAEKSIELAKARKAAAAGAVAAISATA